MAGWEPPYRFRLACSEAYHKAQAPEACRARARCIRGRWKRSLWCIYSRAVFDMRDRYLLCV